TIQSALERSGRPKRCFALSYQFCFGTDVDRSARARSPLLQLCCSAGSRLKFRQKSRYSRSRIMFRKNPERHQATLAEAGVTRAETSAFLYLRDRFDQTNQDRKS